VGESEGAVVGVVDDERVAVGESCKEGDARPVGDDGIDVLDKRHRPVEARHLGAVDGADHRQPLGLHVERSGKAATVLCHQLRVGCVGEAHRAHRHGREAVHDV